MRREKHPSRWSFLLGFAKCRTPGLSLKINHASRRRLAGLLLGEELATKVYGTIEEAVLKDGAIKEGHENQEVTES